MWGTPGGAVSSIFVAPAPSQRRVYAVWFEALFQRALGPRITPALRAELRAIGLDLDQPLAPTYPAPIRLECLKLLRRALFPTLTEDQAWFAFGRALLEGYLQTMVGRGFDLQFRQLGPRALLKRASEVMSTSSNFNSAETIERGPFRWEVRFRCVDLEPAYYRGLTFASLEVCGVTDIEVQLRSQAQDELVFDLSWGAAVSTR